MILRRKRNSRVVGDFAAATFASIDAGMRCAVTRLMDGIEGIIRAGLKVIVVFIECHLFGEGDQAAHCMSGVARAILGGVDQSVGLARLWRWRKSFSLYRGSFASGVTAARADDLIQPRSGGRRAWFEV